MIPNCKLKVKDNITVLIPTIPVDKYYDLEFDQMFWSLLSQSRKKICVVRNSRDLINAMQNRDDDLSKLEENFDLIILEQEGIDDFEFLKQLNPSKFVIVFDLLTPKKLHLEETSENFIFVATSWCWLTNHFNKINKKLWNSSKKYYLTAKMKNSSDWKVNLLHQVVKADAENLINYSALRHHPLMPQTPRNFESEQGKNDQVNLGLPVIEQMQSYSLLCLETNSDYITEKTWGSLFTKCPTIWHTSPVIRYLENYDLHVLFNGFDYSYMDLDTEDQRTDQLARQITNMTANDYIDFYHQNVKEFEHNHQIMQNINHWQNIFFPKIQKILEG